MATSDVERLRDLSMLCGLSTVFDDARLDVLQWDTLICNKERNPRDEKTAYEPDNPKVLDIMHSVKSQGFLAAHPLVVHDEKNGMYDILCGHIRYTVCKLLGITRLPCLILSGLSESQKLVYIHDHGNDGYDLGPIGEYKAVRNCILAGMSRLATAEKLNWKTGKKRAWATSKVQMYDELMRLSKDVQDEWFLQQRDPASTARTMPDLGTEAIRELFKAKTTDEKEFKKLLNDGPTLAAEIAKLKATGKTTKGAEKKAAFSPSSIKAQGDYADNLVFKSYNYGLAGVEGFNPAEFHKKINEACNLLWPNPAPATAPATVPEVFGEAPEPATPVVEAPVVEAPVVEAPVQEVFAEKPAKNGLKDPFATVGGKKSKVTK